LNAEAVVLEIDIKVGQDQLILDELPDDTCHLIAIEFDNGSGYFDLINVRAPSHLLA
jgi:hypothetical protein